MIKQHILLYMISRIFVAATNFFSIIVFSRLAGADIYGKYIIILTTAMVINGFAIQWARYAFFARYRPDKDAEFLSVFMTLGLGSLLVVSLLAVLFFSFTDAAASFTAAAIVLAVSISFFDMGVEISRTRLAAQRVAVATLMRAFSIFAIGIGALVFSGTAWSLALSIALANALSVLPIAFGAYKSHGFKFDWKIAREFGVFGLPLIISFGVGNLAQGMDRFLLNYFDASASVGLYSPVTDTIRSTFLIFGESISLSLMSISKQRHVAGNEEQALQVLGSAYRLILFLCVFGSAFCLVFGEDVLHRIFPALKDIDLKILLPLIVASAALIVIRNTYFAQVIYFSGSSYLELISALLLLVINFGAGWFLIGGYGMFGAAVTFLIAQFVTTAFYILADRHKFIMPTPLAPFFSLLAIGVGLLLASQGVAAFHPAYWVGVALQLTLFIVAAAGVAWFYDLAPSVTHYFSSKKTSAQKPLEL